VSHATRHDAWDRPSLLREPNMPADLLRALFGNVTVPPQQRSLPVRSILTLRHQLNVLQRKSPKHIAFSNFDRLVFAGLYCIAPGVVNA
jgi:hypothetical protein